MIFRTASSGIKVRILTRLMMAWRGTTGGNNIDDRVVVNTHAIEWLKQFVTILETMVQQLFSNHIN